jgi:hypothetical protein
MAEISKVIYKFKILGKGMPDEEPADPFLSRIHQGNLYGIKEVIQAILLDFSFSCAEFNEFDLAGLIGHFTGLERGEGNTRG